MPTLPGRTLDVEGQSPSSMRGAGLAAGVALLVPALLLANVFWMRPEYNWDMLAYVAVAQQLGGASAGEAHGRTYALARERLDARTYELLAGSNAYRRAVAADSVAFRQQLPFYSVKPAYPWLIRVLVRLGVNPIDASVGISQAAYVVIGVVLFTWLQTLLPVGTAWVGALGAMSLPFVLDLGRLSTPDALSTALVLAGLLLVFQLDRPLSGYGVLLSSMLARPDNLLWLLPVGLYAALRSSGRWYVTLPALILPGVGVWLGLSLRTGNAGWRTLFHHSFIERLPYPQEPLPPLSASTYLFVYLRESHPLSVPPFVVLFALLSFWLLLAQIRQARATPNAFLLYAVIAFGVLHWGVYPGEDRFLAPAYLAVLVLLAHRLVGGSSAGSVA